MIIKLQFHFFSIFLALCFFNKSPKYEVYSNEIIQQFRVNTLEPNNFRICSIGGSSDKGIKMIHLGVNIQMPSNVENSRRLMVFLVEQLLLLYNENELIRPFLLDYPFGEGNIQFEISFVNEANTFRYIQDNIDPKDQITYVTLNHGEVCYDIHTGGKIAPLQTVFCESYQDALKIVHDEKFSLKLPSHP